MSASDRKDTTTVSFMCFDLEAAELIFKNAMNYNFCLRILQIQLEIQ